LFNLCSETFFCVCQQILQHKTNQMFGPAQIALTREEFDWMQRFLNIRQRLPAASAAKYFFFTSTTNVCKKLVTYFKRLEVDGPRRKSKLHRCENLHRQPCKCFLSFWGFLFQRHSVWCCLLKLLMFSTLFPPFLGQIH